MPTVRLAAEAPMTLKIKLVAGALAVALMAPAGGAVAQEAGRLMEQDVKAGMIYNFLRYTHWPNGRDGALVVCVYGRDPFAGRLAPMTGRTVNQRPIEVRTLAAGAAVDRCSLLFLNADEREDWPRLRTALSDRGVLTVSDYDGFARAGGMIEFTRANNRVGVRINVAAAEAAQLRVEERLLRLATVVNGR